MTEVAVRKLGLCKDSAELSEEVLRVMQDVPVEVVRQLHGITKAYCRKPPADSQALLELQRLVEEIKQKQLVDAAAKAEGSQTPKPADSPAQAFQIGDDVRTSSK